MVLPSLPQTSDILYPDCDGQPMADNTEQFRWIVVIKENLEWLFADDPNVFVAGDLLWYPVQGNNKIRMAPDALVAIGRPKGRRGSYKQWEEDNLAPQVVFEILSPGNTAAEMNRKLLFYDRYGVEEYYCYDPDTNQLAGWQRRDDFLDVIEAIAHWVSPRLGIRFDWSSDGLVIRDPNGAPFRSFVEVTQQAELATQQAELATQRANAAEQALQAAVPRLLGMGLTPVQVAEALGIPVAIAEQLSRSAPTPPTPAETPLETDS